MRGDPARPINNKPAIAKRLSGNPNWTMGQSGNPNGLAKKAHEVRRIVELIFEEACTVEGRDILMLQIRNKIIEGDSSVMRLACEYRFGKPRQQVEVSVQQAPLEEMSDEALMLIIGAEDEPGKA